MLDGMRIEGRTRFDSTTDEPSNRGLLQEETIPANGASSLFPSGPNFCVYNGVELSKIDARFRTADMIF